MHHDWVDGVVREYDDREGFGVIDSLDTPEGCWFHFSMIEVPGHKTLLADQLVRFTFDSEVKQDGFVFRAVQVRPSSRSTHLSCKKSSVHDGRFLTSDLRHPVD